MTRRRVLMIGDTHFFQVGSPRALCGTAIWNAKHRDLVHSAAPSCGDCARLLHEEAGEIEALKEVELHAKKG